MKNTLFNWSKIGEEFTSTFEQSKGALATFIPNFISALLILLLGWALAKLASLLGKKVGDLIARFVHTIERKHTLTGIKDTSKYPKVLSAFFYWGVLIYALILALQILELPGLSNWLRDLGRLIPDLVAGLIIIIIGFIVANISKNAILSSLVGEEKEPYFLAQVTRYALIIMFVLWGVGQAGLNVRLFVNFLSIIITAVFGAVALGFGLGAKHHVANMIASYNFRKQFKVGETIKIEDYSGTIIDITPTTIVLDTPDGTVVVPAGISARTVSMKSL